MPRFRVTVYLNVDPDHVFGSSPPRDRHRAGPATGDQRARAPGRPERAFTVGNRMAADDNGRRWPPDVRSVSFPRS